MAADDYPDPDERADVNTQQDQDKVVFWQSWNGDA
jgi:hypothetical protein